MAQHNRNTKSAKGSGRGKMALCIALIVVALAVMACAGGVMAVSDIDTIYPNVTLDGHDISGMSEIALSELLFEKGYDNVGDNTLTVQLPLNNTLAIHSSDVCSNTSVAEIVEKVMEACRGGSRVDVALRYLRCRFGGGMALQSGSVMSVDETTVRAIVDNAVKEVNLGLMGSDVKVSEESIRVVKGAAAVTLDTDALTKLIVDAFNSRSFETIVYEGQIHEDNELDLQSLYDNIYCEPLDAYYDPESGEVVGEVAGMSFDLVEAAKLWNAADYGDEVVIPLILSQPEMDAETLSELLFRDKFCSIPTSLWGSSASRINNVTKAAESVNGLVLMPGDEFSYNEALGERTAENGYLPAGAYSDGQTVQEYGGGICQVSSAVYYCALHANLKITSRTCHYFPVGYVPAGLDATVSWGGPEFKFVNNRDYPVKLVAWVEGNQVTVEIWGTDVDGSYVEMSYATELDYDEEYTDVAVGYKAETYRLVYDKNGKLISRTKEANSYYHYHEEDIEWPEEEEETEESPTPSPEESVEPSPEQSEEPTETVEPTEPVEPEPTEPVEPEPTEPVEPEGEQGSEETPPEETEQPEIEHEPWLDAENNGIGL